MDGWRFLRVLHSLLRLTDGHRDVQGPLRTDGKRDIENFCGEAGSGDGHLIVPRNEISDRVQAVGITFCGSHDIGGHVLSRNLRARDDSACGICDGAGNGCSSDLRAERYIENKTSCQHPKKQTNEMRFHLPPQLFSRANNRGRIRSGKARLPRRCPAAGER